MDIFFSHHGFMHLRFTVNHKNTNGIIYVAEIRPLNSFQHYLLHGITTVINRPHFHSLVQLCTVIHVYFDHLCDLQTSENAPGKFDTRTKEVCTFMCKNNAWIQSMCRVIYRSYERCSKSSLEKYDDDVKTCH